jgi:AmmeMemoRadiSam system protein B/AmmeMemoRadiSam system protein A
MTLKQGFQFALPLLILALAASTADAQKDGSAMDQTVRKPAVAGQFYTENPDTLKREITGYLDAAKPPAVEGDIVAIVSPHAGYVYSGQVAAYGYRLVRGKTYSDVVVISPSHTAYFAFASVFPGRAYATPLGEIPVDTELAKLIASKSALVKSDMKGHETSTYQRSEHALEVQLPFLQVALGTFKLVPIVMGDQSEEIVNALGNVLGDVLKGRNVLIVASTDLSHFYDARKAKALDGAFQDGLRAFDPRKLYEELSSKDAEACGGGPVVAAMIAAQKLGATRCEVLHYANSGDVTGDKSSVVGYVSAVMVRGKKTATRQPDVAGKKSAVEKGAIASADPPSRPAGGGRPGAMELTKEDKIYLLKLARSVIDADCRGKKYEAPPAPTPIMKEPRGAFVTLHKGGQLRGCIGYIEAVKPLAATVEEMAHAAAFNDWRFSPVKAEEVPALELEISVLSPIFEITDPSTIVVGTYGLIITRGMNRGLLLPQVASGLGWDRETFLDQTCVKAGLPEGCWKQKGTKIEGFTAEVFSERELGLK